MTLLNKLTKKIGALGLVATLASPFYNSGCEALIIGTAIKSHGDAQARAIRDAAMPRTIYVPTEKPAPPIGNHFFACNNWEGDVDKSGYIEMNELPKDMKTHFNMNEEKMKIGFIVNQPGRFGTIAGGIWDIENEEYVKIFSSPKNSDYLAASIPYSLDSLKPGKYRIHFEFNGERIATINDILITEK